MDTYTYETRLLAREIGDEETAANMIRLAMIVGQDYSYPVVTRTLKGEVIGVRYDKISATLIAGRGTAVGHRYFD